MHATSVRGFCPWLKRPMFAALTIAVFLQWSSPASAQIGNWRQFHWHLWRINVDGTGLQPLDQMPDGRCGSPDWSPDGEFILYDFSRDGPVPSGAQIAVIRADGSDRRLVGRGGVASWSPDGKLIVCQYTPGEGTVVMNADGSGRESIVSESGGGAVWSPRGNRIALSGGTRLLDLATGRRQSIFSVQSSIFHGYSVSPDGLHVCFGTFANEVLGSKNGAVGVATLDERTMQASVRWVVDTGIAYAASWSPDGRRIVFAWHETRDELIQIYTLDLDSNEPPKLLPGLDLTRNNVEPDWSPDGSSIVFSTSAP